MNRFVSWTLALAAASVVLVWTCWNAGPAEPLARLRTDERTATPVPLTSPVSAAPADLPAASTEPTALSIPPSNALPSWLWGQPDLSPASVLQAWHAYARTQGKLYDTAQELVDYAKQHPQRVAGVNGLTHDAWLDAVAQDPQGRDIAHRLLASGYLDNVLAQSLEQFGPGVDTVKTQEAVADLRAFAQCESQECAGWTALLALSPDHAVAAFGALARAARECGGPQVLETFFRSAETFGATAEAANALDWPSRKRLALNFAKSQPGVVCSG